METVKTLMRNIDRVGYSPKLFYGENTKFKTVLGGIFTILLVILTLLASVSFGQDIWKRANPTILINNNFIEPTLNIGQTLS